MLGRLCFFALLLAYCQALSCHNGSWVMQTATYQVPDVLVPDCSGVCQLLAGTTGELIQTASCVSAQTCAENALVAYPAGNNYSAVLCCDTDNCNDPTQAVFTNPIPCASQTNLVNCSMDLNCGWCGATSACMTGNFTGPTTGTCGSGWNYPWNNVTVVTQNGQTSLLVYLRPGVPAVVNFTPPSKLASSVELLLVADATSSMGPAIQSLNFEQVSSSLNRPLQVGVSSFHGMPQAPLGVYPRDYLFNLNIQLTSNLSEANPLDVLGQSELPGPHASLSALLYAAAGSQVAWNQSARFALIFTNANSSVQGDGAVSGIFTPNNYNGILDAAQGQAPGAGEDFPSPSNPAYASAIIGGGVYPLFGFVNCAGKGGCPSYNNGVQSFYNSIVAGLGFGQVLDLSAAYTGGSVSDTIASAIESVMTSTSTTVYDSDPLGRIVSSNGAFQRTLFISPSSQSFQDSTVRLQRFPYLDSPSAILTTVIPGVGCDGTLGGPVYDSCGVCGGTNECLQCVSGTRDVCGVCGGDGTTCMGCNGVANSGLSYDICGICGGNGTTCIGCDGILNSGLTFSACGVCGQSPIECERGNALHPLGIAGIVMIIVGFFFLLLFLIAFIIGKRALDHKESKLKKDQLFIEAQQRYKLSK